MARHNFRGALGLLSLLSGAIVFWSTRPWGVGIFPDSVVYISVARNLLAGHGLHIFDGTVLVDWPPLYPALLAGAGKLLGADPFTLAPWVNVVLWVGIVYLSGWFARTQLELSSGFALAVALAVAVSIPLFLIAVTALSEALFIFWMLASFGLAYAYRQRSQCTTLALWAGTIALATLTRYVGVTLMLWGAVLFATTKKPGRRRMRHWVCFALFSAVPIGLWWLRNWQITGTLTGARAPSRYTIGQNFVSVFHVLTAWFIPKSLASNPWLWLLAGSAVGILLALSWREARAMFIERTRRLWPIALFAGGYTLFLVITAAQVAYDPLDDRLLAPLFIPLAWLCFGAAEVLLLPYRRRVAPHAMTLFLLMALGVGLRYPLSTMLYNVAVMRSYGLEYGSKSWRESPTIRYVREHDETIGDCPLYSNDQYALYLWADVQAHSAPTRGPYNSSLRTHTLEDIRGTWPPEDQACLVWFTAVQRPHLFSLQELQTAAQLDPIAHLSDGALYRVHREPRP